MKVVIDIEANGLKPTKVWVIVCKDIDTGQVHIFRNPSDDENVKRQFNKFAEGVVLWIGHNIVEYDIPVLVCLIQLQQPNINDCCDTLIVSKLVDYSRVDGHSIESYGKAFGLEKIEFSAWSKYSLEMEEYCVRDVEISHLVYLKYLAVINSRKWRSAISLEHSFQLVVNDLHNNGFHFNTAGATHLLERVEKDLAKLDASILQEFPPREIVIRTFTPKATKFRTISKSSVPRSLLDKIHEYEVGKTYTFTKLEPFNPSSPKQVVHVLNEAGWNPVHKTKTHVDVERALRTAKGLDLEILSARMVKLKEFGWKINEENLDTLPSSAPSSARTLAKRILTESRRRTLNEWLSLVGTDSRIHGKFYGQGAWTGRMAHQKPNTANIPNEVYISTGKPKLFGKEMRSLWGAPKKRLLVGVDAEAIQLRVFAHLINSPELTEAIVNGKKADKTDPHSLNQKVFGSFCKTRNAAKHSLYAVFFGGRANKISQIMDCSKEEAELAIQRLIEKYPGLARLEQETFPRDARRGFFIGLDGREVPIPSDTISGRKHLCMSGYLQNGEAIVMKKATLIWKDKLKAYDSLLVDLVHDEWQVETPADMKIAVEVAKMLADSLVTVGEELKLNCPLAGSYWNDDKQDYTIGTNWYQTH